MEWLRDRNNIVVLAGFIIALGFVVGKLALQALHISWLIIGLGIGIFVLGMLMRG